MDSASLSAGSGAVVGRKSEVLTKSLTYLNQAKDLRGIACDNCSGSKVCKQRQVGMSKESDQ